MDEQVSPRARDPRPLPSMLEVQRAGAHQTRNATRFDPRQQSGADGLARDTRDVLSDLLQNVERLARQELQLGLAELDQKVLAMRASLAGTARASAVLYAGALCLAASLILLLSWMMAAWLAALFVGIAATGIGYAMLREAKTDLAPDIPAMRLKAQALAGSDETQPPLKDPAQSSHN